MINAIVALVSCMLLLFLICYVSYISRRVRKQMISQVTTLQTPAVAEDIAA